MAGKKAKIDPKTGRKLNKDGTPRKQRKDARGSDQAASDTIKEISELTQKLAGPVNEALHVQAAERRAQLVLGIAGKLCENADLNVIGDLSSAGIFASKVVTIAFSILDQVTAKVKADHDAALAASQAQLEVQPPAPQSPTTNGVHASA